MVNLFSTSNEIREAVSQRLKESLCQVSRTDDGTFDGSNGDVQEIMSIWPRDLEGIFIVIFTEKESLDRL